MEGSRKNVVSPFVVQTYQLVNDGSVDDIISWGTLPNSFIVRKPIEFTNTLLPKCFQFKRKDFQLFLRRLRYYGFWRLRSDAMELAHSKFVRFEPHLLLEIKGTSRPSKSRVDVSLRNLELAKERFRLERDLYSIELARFRELQAASARITQLICQSTSQLDHLTMTLRGKSLVHDEHNNVNVSSKERISIHDQPMNIPGTGAVLVPPTRAAMEPPVHDQVFYQGQNSKQMDSFSFNLDYHSH